MSPGYILISLSATSLLSTKIELPAPNVFISLPSLKVILPSFLLFNKIDSVFVLVFALLRLVAFVDCSFGSSFLLTSFKIPSVFSSFLTHSIIKSIPLLRFFLYILNSLIVK